MDYFDLIYYITLPLFLKFCSLSVMLIFISSCLKMLNCSVSTVTGVRISCQFKSRLYYSLALRKITLIFASRKLLWKSNYNLNILQIKTNGCWCYWCWIAKKTVVSHFNIDCYIELYKTNLSIYIPPGKWLRVEESKKTVTMLPYANTTGM